MPMPRLVVAALAVMTAAVFAAPAPIAPSVDRPAGVRWNDAPAT